MARLGETRYPVVSVDWVDAAQVQGGWNRQKATVKRARKLAVEAIHSAGLLLDSSPDSITIGLSHNPNNDDVSMVFVIPRTAIRQISTWTGEVPVREGGQDA